MVYRTVIASSYDACISECPALAADRVLEKAARQERMSRFPFTVMLQVSFPELDFANRWCWSRFGPSDGECQQMHSEYRSCTESMPHTHIGCWSSYWFEKTDYDFGFNEWYFESSFHRDLFTANLSKINWGEHYEK